MDEQTQLATMIAHALDTLHDAFVEAQKRGYRLQIMVDAIDDLPVPAVHFYRDGEGVWCGAEHLMGTGV